MSNDQHPIPKMTSMKDECVFFGDDDAGNGIVLVRIVLWDLGASSLALTVYDPSAASPLGEPSVFCVYLDADGYALFEGKLNGE